MTLQHHIAIQVVLAGALAAQSQSSTATRKVDPLRSGVIEFGVAGGWAAGDVGGAQVNLPGVITYRVEGNQGPAGKLHLGLGLGARYQFVAEAALLSGGRAKQDLGGGFQVETRAAAIAYTGSMHFRLKAGRRWVPYLAAGAGSVQSRTDTLVVFAAPVVAAGTISSSATRVRLKEGSLAPVAGLGTQFFSARKRVGLRMEALSYFPTGSSRTPFVQLSVGVLTWLR